MKDKIVVISSIEKNEFFFSTDQYQKHGLGESFFAYTYLFPLYVTPRQSLPTGIITCKEDIINVLYNNVIQRINPDNNFQPENSKTFKFKAKQDIKLYPFSIKGTFILDVPKDGFVTGEFILEESEYDSERSIKGSNIITIVMNDGNFVEICKDKFEMVNPLI